jgi:deoxyribose-phosphate aldolase
MEQLATHRIIDVPPRRPVDAVMAARRAESFGKRSIKSTSKDAALRMAVAMTDLTTLEGKDSPERVRALCRKAIAPAPHLDAELRAAGRAPVPSVAAVCVYPNLVAVARDALEGSGVKVASVATAFPSGQYPLDLRIDDTRRAVEAGAHEIDMVISRGTFLAGDYRRVADEIAEVREACGNAHLKIILETGELETLDAVRHASDLAIRAALSTGPAADGDVFIKTSTGNTSCTYICKVSRRRQRARSCSRTKSSVKTKNCVAPPPRNEPGVTPAPVVEEIRSAAATESYRREAESGHNCALG